MLIEIAIGDAYGAGFEFAKKERLKQLKNDLGQYYKHNLPGNLEAGMYTDDTQMSIGISEALIDLKTTGKPWTVENLADKFIEVYKRDPRDGYSRKFQEILGQVNTGDELRAMIIPNSDKCGAAMRSVPLGLLDKEKDIMKMAHIQASLTHNTTNGILSSQAVALASHWNLISDSFIGLNDYLNFQLGTKIDWTGWPVGEYVSTDAIDVVKAAISAYYRGHCGTKVMSSILKECIDYTGDVDSVAAIAMGLSSLNVSIKNDLPAVLLSGLENNGFGRDYLVKLDAELVDLFNLHRI